eukprot:757988-Hanusia_phi.AAC.2
MPDGSLYMWMAKRSESKIAYPGLWDQLVSHHQMTLLSFAHDVDRVQGDEGRVFGTRTTLSGTSLSFSFPSTRFTTCARENAISAAMREASISSELLGKLKSTRLNDIETRRVVVC